MPTSPVDDRPDERRPDITAGGIARLAGVGRAAVSNWRRRHEDFPRPVGGTAASPTFALLEVEQWLHDHGKLTEVPPGERAWQLLQTDGEGAVGALARGADRLFDGDSAPPDDDHAARAVHAFADSVGPVAAYEALLDRLIESGLRQQFTHTPRETAALMAALAGPASSVLDPACGTGGLLAAIRDATDGAGPECFGRDRDAGLARLAGLRLGLRGAAADIRAGDSLLDVPYPPGPVDAVLCHPPTNDRHWGHDELAYDLRWTYGLPARAESELAWVQTALSHLVEGGTAVLLLPPGVASRRSGRRVRAALLRRGALRAVITLPAGAAPPHHLPLHLWVLTRPGGESSASPRILLLDVSGTASPGEGAPDWSTVRRTVESSWAAFRRHGRVDETPGERRALPVIELLDDETDLTPARHLTPPDQGPSPEALADTQHRLRVSLQRAGQLLSATAPELPRGPATSAGATPAGADPAGTAPAGAAPSGATRSGRPPTAGGPSSGPAAGEPWPELTLGELHRTGALELHSAVSADALPDARPGDIYLPLVPDRDGAAPLVVTRAGVAPPVARHVVLLRPDTDALCPWFVAGFLRATANVRQASSYATTATRIEPRRLRLPRLPLPEQRAYGQRFRELAELEEMLDRISDLGRGLVRGTVDGLADGSRSPG